MIMKDLLMTVYDSEDGLNGLFNGLSVEQNVDLLLTCRRVFEHEIDEDIGKILCIPYRDSSGVRLRFVFRETFLNRYRPVNPRSPKVVEPRNKWLCDAVRILTELRDSHEGLFRGARFGENALELLCAAELAEPLEFTGQEIAKAFLYPYARIPVFSGMQVTTVLDEITAEIGLELQLRRVYDYCTYWSCLGCDRDALSLAEYLLENYGDPVVLRSCFSRNHMDALKELQPLVKSHGVLKAQELEVMDVKELRKFAGYDVLFLLECSAVMLGWEGERNLEELIEEGIRVIAFCDSHEKVCSFSSDLLNAYFAAADEINIDRKHRKEK